MSLPLSQLMLFESSLIVFSLPNRAYGDLALLNSVLAEFSQYGKCFGVVRRNVNPKTGMVRPYVILQYTVRCLTRILLVHNSSADKVSETRPCTYGLPTSLPPILAWHLYRRSQAPDLPGPSTSVDLCNPQGLCHAIDIGCRQ